jgi:acetyl esterase/lipase
MKYLQVGMIALLLSASSGFAAEPTQPQPTALWPNGAPDSQGKDTPESVRITELGEHVVSNVHRPSITPYLPASGDATGAAVIVIPGGGHRELWMDHEGYRVGAWLRDHGIAAFVLKYRLAGAPDSSYTVEGDELRDVQRAIRLVRSRSQDWHIAPDRIGVIGFSAGGELAALAATRYGDAMPYATDSVDRMSARPDFASLIYPAIPKDLHLPKDLPPVFLLCGANDAPEIADGVPSLYLAIRHGGGSAELHILDGVGHGFGLRDSNPPSVAIWTTLFVNWLGERGILGAR